MKFDGSRWDEVCAVILYCTLSPILTWLNKFILIVPFCSRNIQGGPFLVVFFQQLSTFFVLTAVKIAGAFLSNLQLLLCPKRHQEEISVGGEEVQQLSSLMMETPASFFGLFDFSIAIDSIPAALCFVAQLTLSNACLRAIPMSSYQATRSSSLVFSILVNRLILVEPVSASAFISSVIVCVGFILSVFDPAQSICYSSIILGILASLAGVLFMALCRQKMQKQATETELCRWISFDCSLFLLPFLLFELDTISEYGATFFSPIDGNGSATQRSTSSTFLSTTGTAMIATMVLSPLIPLCTTTCLRYMTPLGCTVIGFAKSCLQSVVGNWMFGDPLSSRSVFGVVLCLIGCCTYSVSGKSKQAKGTLGTPAVELASANTKLVCRSRDSTCIGLGGSRNGRQQQHSKRN